MQWQMSPKRIRRVAQVMTIIPLSHLMGKHPPKKTPESKRNETFPLKRNEKNTIYINESGLYGLLLPDQNFYAGKAFDFPRLFLVYRSQPLFCTLPVQRPY